jgi:hypothetical protein
VDPAVAVTIRPGPLRDQRARRLRHDLFIENNGSTEVVVDADFNAEFEKMFSRAVRVASSTGRPRFRVPGRRLFQREVDGAAYETKDAVELSEADVLGATRPQILNRRGRNFRAPRELPHRQLSGFHPLDQN